MPHTDAPPERTDRPNVVLITCHDVGQHLGCYGIDSVETPALDELADSGCRFENAVATAPSCGPSRGSLLSGRYPQSNGLMGNAHAPWWWSFEDGERLLPELLAEAGYATHLVGRQNVTSPREPERLGFEHSYTPNHDAEETTAVFDDVVADATGAAPFYAQVGFLEAHRSFGQEPDPDADVTDPTYLDSTDETRDDLARFEAEVGYLDDRTGELLDSLDRHGVRDDTIVLFAADHGIPYPGAKGRCGDPGVEIALLMDGPGSAFEMSSPVDPVISVVDVVPTLLDHLSISVPDRVEGVSFHEYLTGETNEPPREAAYTLLNSEGDEARSVVTEEHTLIRNFGASRTVDYPVDVHGNSADSSGSEPRPFAQLYDRTDDPGNVSDVAADRPAITQELSDRVRSWMARVEDPLLYGGVPYPFQERARRNLLGGDR